MKVKYQACWLISEGEQQPDEFDPDLCVYGNKDFADLDKAKKHVLDNDLFDGGTVHECEYTPFEDGEYGMVPDWTTVGVWRPCGDEWEFERYESD